MDPDNAPQTRLSTYTPQEDSSSYIRTYAKDVAHLTGAAVSTPTPPPITQAAPEPVQETAPIVEPIVQETPAPVFSPELTPVPEVPAPLVQEIAPIQAIPSTQTADAEREVILARLRAKLEAEKAALQSVPEIVDAPPEPKPEPIPVQVQPRPIPVYEPLPVRPLPVASTPSPIHTFSSDFADRIDTQSASTFSVLATQSDAGQARPIQHSPSRRRVLPLVVGIVMVLIGIGAIGGALIFSHKTVQTVFSAKVPSLITFDESVEVKGSGQELQNAIAKVAGGTAVTGNVLVTYTTSTATSSTSTSIPQPGGVLIRKLGLNAPDILLRNIDDSSTVGTIKAGNESRPFMILKVNSYERTFAGMLAWESTMAQDLSTFYPAYADAAVTGTTTASTTTTPALSPVFSDAVLANYNVRILRDAQGRSLVMYGYKDKDILIIARDEAAFSALAARVSAAGL